MKKILLPLIALILVVFGFGYYLNKQDTFFPQSLSTFSNTSSSSKTVSNEQAVSVIAQNLDTPWAIAFLPDKDMLVTERNGNIRYINSTGKLQDTPVIQLPAVQEIGEGGLLGIALDPDFVRNKYVYVYYTYDNQNGNTQNRVARMTYNNKKLSNETIILDAIPGASNHNGGRIAFGPDKYLYIATGDAQAPSEAQNTKSLAGKILRVTNEGKPAPGNPFKNEVYSYGHRNPQGIAWDGKGQLWSTEHGRSGALSGLDEVNRIERGGNYGWPEIQGNEQRNGMKNPTAHSGEFSTWAPGGMAIVGDTLFFAGLRGSALYKGMIEETSLSPISEYFKDTYGRIREVMRGPDDMLYITTSNLDGRGRPKENDDKIIKIDPTQL